MYGLAKFIKALLSDTRGIKSKNQSAAKSKLLRDEVMRIFHIINDVMLI